MIKGLIFVLFPRFSMTFKCTSESKDISYALEMLMGKALLHIQEVR